MTDRDTATAGSNLGGYGGSEHGGGGQKPGVSQPKAEDAGAKASQALGTAKDKAQDVGAKASQAMDTAKEKTDQLSSQAMATADVGMDKAADGLDRAADLLREQSSRFGGVSTRNAVAMTADRLDQAGQYLRDKDTDQLMADVEALVRRKPAESLLVAAGLGLLLSKVLR
ncbi:MAG: hypothetical protein M3R06_10265 [Chloroflexota bacterium]|nr:hypothetical protein [Chloroflexota bacterium]